MYNKIRLHHIAIAVKDLHRARFMFENIFGVDFSLAENIESQKVKVAFTESEDAKIELIQATDTRSPIFPLMDHPILSFIKKNGEGLHHICFQVENLEDIIAGLHDALASRLPLREPEIVDTLLPEMGDEVLMSTWSSA